MRVCVCFVFVVFLFVCLFCWVFMSPLCVAQTQSHFVQAVGGSQCLVPDMGIGDVEEHVNDILSPHAAVN